jgi:hypothetical protein
MKKETVVRFRMVVIALNCLLASLSLINLYTVASGAIKVDIPEETDFAWTVDTSTDEATFLADFTVENKGVYDITDLDIHAIVTTESGTMLVDYIQKDLTIPSGESKKFNIFATMPFDRVDLDEWRTLMVNDSVFYLDVDIEANYLWGLGKFVVDDTLVYDWEAPLGKMANKTDDTVLDLLRYIFTENLDLDGFVDYVAQEVNDNPIITRFDWNNAELRVESWPAGYNTSRITAILTLDLLGGRRTLTFDASFIMTWEGEEYEIKFVGFNFQYR